MHGKIYSCSMFFNELDLLELKLETLSPVVDYFVISESTFTHSGKPKPLIFNENKDRFKKFNHKIIHQIITDTPSKYVPDLPHNSSKDVLYNLVVDRVNQGGWWDHRIESYGRDTFEKESLIRPLTSLEKNDIILLSDLDEIVRPERLKEVLAAFDYNQTYHFQHDMFYYYLNLQKDEPWYGTIALSYEKFLEPNNSFCSLRTHKQGIFIEKAGWHFTFQGGADKIKEKLESYGEQSLNLPYIKDNIKHSIIYSLESGKDLFGRPCTFTLRWAGDSTFPEYLVKHRQDIFKDMVV